MIVCPVRECACAHRRYFDIFSRAAFLPGAFSAKKRRFVSWGISGAQIRGKFAKNMKISIFVETVDENNG